MERTTLEPGALKRSYELNHDLYRAHATYLRQHPDCREALLYAAVQAGDCYRIGYMLRDMEGNVRRMKEAEAMIKQLEDCIKQQQKEAVEANKPDPRANPSNTKRSIALYYRCKWSALVRLTCYCWLLVLLAVLGHYEPGARFLVIPAVNVVLFAVGLCLGKHYRLFGKRKGSKRRG